MSSGPSRAIFLSYATEDRVAAQRIAESLRAVGVEVWFDQSELSGGDAWDHKIRQQIRDCALFMPVISAATQRRREAYFRLEWRLADERTHLMAKGTPFLLPVTVDDTSDRGALVPDSFLAAQWTPLPGGDATADFCARVKHLLEAGDGSTEFPTAVAARRTASGKPASAWRWMVPALVVVGAIAWLALRQPWHATGVPAADSLVSQARSLMDDPMRVKESYRAAEDLGARAVELNPQDAEAWAVYADAATRLIENYHDTSAKRRADARSRAERAIRLDPDSLSAVLAMARYEATADDARGPAAAEQRLEPWLEKYPQEKRLWRTLGDVREFQGKYDAAIDAYDRSNALPGGDADALAGKAWAYYHADRVIEAISAADASIAMKPNTQAYGAKLIALYSGTVDLQQTRALIESLPPAQLREDRVAYISHDTWMNLREPARAAEALMLLDHDFIEEGRLTMPTHFGIGEARSLMGQTSAAQIEYEAALATVEQRLEAEPTNDDLAGWKTLTLARLGRRQEAEHWFRVTLELRGIRPDDLSRISPMTLIALGRPKDALRALELRFADGNLRRSMARLDTNPAFDPLRDEPRFKSLLSRLDQAR